MFVSIPSRVGREAERSLTITARDTGEPCADYSISRQTIEIPFWRANLIDDEGEKKKAITAAKPGDSFVLEPKVDVTVNNRVIQIATNKLLNQYGQTVYDAHYRHGEKVGRITWNCTKAFDLKKLPWLYEIYIVDQAIK